MNLKNIYKKLFVGFVAGTISFIGIYVMINVGGILGSVVFVLSLIAFLKILNIPENLKK